MKLKINLYNSEGNRYGLPKLRFEISAWVTSGDFSRFCQENSINPNAGAIYIKIEYKHPLQSVTLYAKLDELNSRIAMEEGTIWVPKELIPRENYINPNDLVDISYVEMGDLPLAESIEIKLPKDDVIYWSEDEDKTAALKFKTHNKIAYKRQQTPINPITKEVVMGEVDYIYPKDDTTELYRIGNTTIINFEGLPESREKRFDLSQVGGLEKTINRIREIIQIPMNYPEYFTHLGIERPKGMLLYGPPGNGKSLIAKGLAKSLGASFIEIDLSDALSKYVGGGEKLLKSKFKEAESYREGIIFIDEIDSLAQIRSDKSEGYEITLVGTLLNLMDGLNSNSRVFVIGATNRPDAIDPALRRPGRFDLEIEIPLPNLAAREDILHKYIDINNPEILDESITLNFIKRLAELTSGYSGADIKSLYREAGMNAIRKWMNISREDGHIEMRKPAEEIRLADDDFLEVIRNNVPSALRGLEMRKEVVLWDDILALDYEKALMEQLHRQLVALTSNTNNGGGPLVRPSFANVLITGKRGTGKHTFVASFARYFEYEMLELDFIALEAMERHEAYRTIDMIFTKCRQITPSILVLSNLEKVQQPEPYIHKTLNEINKIAKHLPIFVCCLCENDSIKEQLCDYKGFLVHLNFDKEKVDIIKTLLKIYDEKLVFELTEERNRIGAILTALHEQQLLNKNN